MKYLNKINLAVANMIMNYADIMDAGLISMVMFYFSTNLPALGFYALINLGMSLLKL